jgi:hypothetical protein
MSQAEEQEPDRKPMKIGGIHSLMHRIQPAKCNQPWHAMDGSGTVRTCPSCLIKVYRAADDQELSQLISEKELALKEKIYRRYDGTFSLESGNCSMLSWELGVCWLIFTVGFYVFGFSSPNYLGALLNGLGIFLGFFMWKHKLQRFLWILPVALLAAICKTQCSIDVLRFIVGVLIVITGIVLAMRLRQKFRQHAAVEKGSDTLLS